MASTLACSGKSSTNVTPEASLEDTQASERLYQLAEIIGASKTIPGTLGLWALVVDAAPRDVRGVSEGLLALMIQEEDIELEEAAYDEDFLLVRAVTTGWTYYEEGVRDVDVLVAAAVEALEKDVTEQDMLFGLVSNDTRRSSIRWAPGAHWHLCRVWHGQRCTLLTSSHPCLSVPHCSPSHCPMHTHHTYWDFTVFTAWEINMVFSPFDGWLTFHGLWYKRVDAQMNTETTTLQEIYTFFSSFYYLSTDG